MTITEHPLSQNQNKSYNTNEASEKLIIEGILKNSERIIAMVYENNFIKIKRMVWSFRNTILDPDDIFQEGLTRAILNIKDGRFRGDSSFSSYLNGICRNICLKQLSKRRTYELKQDAEAVEEETHFELIKSLLVIKKKMDEKCVRIIDLRFSLDGMPQGETPNKCLSFDEIAIQLGINAAGARQQFKRCLDKLRAMVSMSPELSEYFTR